MSKYITLRKQLHHIERLAQKEPLSYNTQDEIAKTSAEALREVDLLETPPPTAPQVRPLTNQQLEDKEVAA